MDALANRDPHPSSVVATSAPVVFVPASNHPDRGWDLLRRHLERAGFRDVGLLAETGRGDIPHRANRLAHQVDTLLALTGAEQVHVVGHNVGGLVARYYLQLLGGDRHMTTLVTIATPHHGTELTPVGLGAAAAQLRAGSPILRHLDESVRPVRARCINYFSDDDVFVRPAASGMLTDPRLRAVNVLVPEHRQLSLALPTVVCRSAAHEIAASAGLPGYGAPLAALPGGIVRLAVPAAVGTAGDARSAAVERSRAAHPSSYPGPARRLSAS